MTRTKLASVGFVATRHCMLQQVLDDAKAKSLPNRGRSQSATACDSSYAPNSAQYYSLLQSTTPTLLLTTKYYSSTTLYCKVLLQYYSVLQWTTLYSVLQNCTPELLCTTKYYSSTTKYYKVTLMIDTRYIWNVIYNARGNRCHPPNSPNTAPATQNDPKKSDRNLLKTAETSFAVRGRFLLLDSTIMYTHQKSYGDGTCLIVIVKKCVKQTGVSEDEETWGITYNTRVVINWLLEDPAMHYNALRFGLPCFLLPAEVLAMIWIVVDC